MCTPYGVVWCGCITIQLLSINYITEQELAGLQEEAVEMSSTRGATVQAKRSMPSSSTNILREEMSANVQAMPSSTNIHHQENLIQGMD